MIKEKKRLANGIIKEIAEEMGVNEKTIYYRFYRKKIDVLEKVANKLEERKNEEKRLTKKIENLIGA